MHHGTIMFDSDLSVVGEALRVDPTKIQTKGIRSVRSRVTNVAEHLPERVTLPEFRRILLENILRENQGEEYPLTPDDLAAVEKLRAERYATWEWNYGRSPACTMLRRRRVDGCGLIEAYITVEHGLISVVAFKGDFFSAEEPEDLAARFVGPYAGPRRLHGGAGRRGGSPLLRGAAGRRVDRHPVRGIKKRIAAIAKSSDGIYVTFKNIKRSCRNHGSSVLYVRPTCSTTMW